MSETDTQARGRNNRLDRATRLSRLAQIGRDHGYFRRIGQRHSVLFVEEESDTLLVTFDTAERVLGKSPDGLPIGFPAVQKWEWSLLNIMGSRHSWFREDQLYTFFDTLVDTGFFDRFDRVVFLGLGPMCGYAAAAFSVVAPAARVLAISPAATLDRDDAPFEQRFRPAWRHDFRSRYGYAPTMIEGAEAVTLIYDPTDPMSAAHAALFRGDNVARHKLRHGGMSIGAILSVGDALSKLLAAAARGPVSDADFARITRPSRRNFLPYIAALMTRADQVGHPRLALMAAEHGQRLAVDGRFDRAVEVLRGRIGAD
ncbi:phosphoadenosine phosphosulfate reductase [Rhodobacterales bacterium HKCCE2091]|nr:phosphoadenosine phosphosulfate reductase [Rhodobacterales bacterium HKCCE2091]